MNKLSHINDAGHAQMVDIGAKPQQIRTATAYGQIALQKTTIEQITSNKIKKGNVLTVAEIAGIQAAKQTSGLIPLCHQIQLTNIELKTTITVTGIEVESTAHSTGATGVEMEALTAVSIALLTIYDMCKAIDKTMQINNISLKQKTKENI